MVLGQIHVLSRVAARYQPGQLPSTIRFDDHFAAGSEGAVDVAHS
jgi:hypothetical protein